MNRQEFLQALTDGLVGVGPEERVAALQYYTEYFDDAGPQDEEKVLQELGDPQKVIADILAGGEDGENWAPPEKNKDKGPVLTLEDPTPYLNADTAPFTGADTTSFDQQVPRAPEPPLVQATMENKEQPIGQPNPPRGAGGSYPPPIYNTTPTSPLPPPPSRTDHSARNILIILAIIFLSPLLLGVLGTLVGLFVSLVVLLATPIIAGVGFVVGGIVGAVVGVFVLGSSVGSGLVNIGLGIILTGVGLLCIYGGRWLLAKIIPATVRGIAGLCKKIFHR